MSSGTFSSSIYETDAGGLCNCRVQPETLALTLGGTANTAAAGPADQEASALMSGGRQRIGVIARAVSLKWTAGAPDGYDENTRVRVPILTKSLYDLVSRGTTGTYLGESVEVVGRIPERVN